MKEAVAELPPRVRFTPGAEGARVVVGGVKREELAEEEEVVLVVGRGTPKERGAGG